MKKFWIILGSIVGGLVFLAYLAFLFVLPNAIDLNQYKPMVQKLVKEQIPLNVDFKNAKITTTPLLSIGVKADDISVQFEDGKTLFFADNAKFRIALPSLLLLTAKVSTAEINNPKFNFTIVDGKQFKILMLVEQILQKQEEQITNETTAEVETAFDTSFIRIKVPNFILNNYDVKIVDEKSGHNLELKGDSLKLAYLNGKVVKVKTVAEFYSDKDKNITADIDINSFLPPVEKLDAEDDKPERVELPFVNPVLAYREYNLKSNLSTKLKIRENKGQIRLNGFLNIDNTTLKLADYNLPECYFHGIFRGTKGDIDTTVSVAKGKNIALKGLYDYGKNKKLDMVVKTDRIYFNDLIILAKAYLDSLHIKNDLNLIKGLGYLEANANLNTNFKKLVSEGKILVRDGGIVNKSINLGITKTNVNLLLDNNVLDIKDTHTYINNAILKAEGKIDEKSIADIKIYANKVPVPSLYRAFAPNDVKRSININKGNVSLNAKINGKLKELICDAKVNLEGFIMSDKSNSFRVINDDLEIKLNSDTNKSLNTIEILNKGLTVLLPQTNSTIKDNVLKINIDGTRLRLNPTDVLLNNTSKITFEGVIDSDKKEPVFNIKGNGNLIATDLKKYAGTQAAQFIDAKGQIPLDLTIEGDTKRQNMVLRLLASAENYITPVTLKQTYGKNTVLQAKVDFKGDRLKIKDTGLYNISYTTDEDGNKVEQLDEVAGINGTITNLNSTPFINVIRIKIPNELSGTIHGFRNAGFNLNGKMLVFGNSASPRMRGKFNLKNLYIKDLLTTMDNLALDFRGKTLNVNARNLLLNGSDISAQTDISLEPSNIIHINNLRVNSNNIDLDKMMMVATTASRIVPQGNTPAAAPTDIPVALRNSFINLRHIKTGNINLRNTTADISLLRNNLYIDNLRTRAFDGNMHGKIAMNLLSNMLKIDVAGDNVNTEKLFKDTANIKDALTGKMSFNSDLLINAGTTDYNEQMKSLLGKVEFSVKDGQFGPFGKLENMILAENIRESQFFQTALGGVLNGLTSIDTTHYKELKGSISFKDGITTLAPITSDGNVLTLYIAGDFDLLKNTADMKVRARLASMVSNVLGPIANVNPVNLVKVTPGLNVASAKLFTLFTQPVTQEELDAIPAFDTKTDNLNATKFQIIVRGDVNKPMSLVKSFKWLALQSQIDKAENFVATLPEPDSLDATVEDMEEKQIEEAKTTSKIKNIFFKKDKKQEEEKIQETKKLIEQMEKSQDTKIEDL